VVQDGIPEGTADPASSQTGELVRLDDGSEILIRPIQPSDKAPLLAGFEELSSRSRYRRFLSPMTRLEPRWLDYLTAVDHQGHEALIATSAGAPAGVARYIRLPEDRFAAEVAITIVDSWQGRGVGSTLLARLAMRAREEGIATFRATCLAENRAIVQLLRELGPTTEKMTGQGVEEVTVDLWTDTAEDDSR